MLLTACANAKPGGAMRRLKAANQWNWAAERRSEQLITDAMGNADASELRRDEYSWEGAVYVSFLVI